MICVYLSIGLKVIQKILEDLDRLCGPTSLSETEFLGLTGTSYSSSETSEGNATLMVEDIFKVFLGVLHGHALHGSGHFKGVLEMHS